MRQTEIALTKRPVKITPATVHTIAIILATNDKGSRSPYLRRKHESKVVGDLGILGGRKRSRYGRNLHLHHIYMFWHSATSLWLVADFASVTSYTTSRFGNIKPSRPCFYQVTTQQGQTTTPGTPCPTLFERCVGSFTSRRIMKNCETGPTVLSSLSEKTRKSKQM